MRIIGNKEYEKLKEDSKQLNAIRSYFLQNKDCDNYIANYKTREAFNLGVGDIATAVIGVMDCIFDEDTFNKFLKNAQFFETILYKERNKE